MNTRKIAVSLTMTFIRLIILLAVIVFIYNAGLAAYDFGFRLFTENTGSDEAGREVEVTVLQGKGTMEVGRILESKGLVEDARMFYVHKLISERGSSIKPGVYTLNTSMSIQQILKTLTEKEQEQEEAD